MINRVTLLGNLGNDPDIKTLSSVVNVANVSLATSNCYKDKTTGERKEVTEWHRVIFFNKLADIVGQYLRKGSQIYVEGRIHTRKWTDKDGIERYSTEIIAETMKMIGGKLGVNAAPTQEPKQDERTDNFADFNDDDIPF